MTFAASGGVAAAESHTPGSTGDAGRSGQGGAGATLGAGAGGRVSAGASSPAGQGGSVDRTFARWPMPEALEDAPLKPSYTVMAETVVDNVTHLVWQRRVPALYEGCKGQYGANSPVGDACTWDEAKRYCASAPLSAALAGSGWHLPTRIELESIIDETRTNPAIDSDAFPGTPSDEFWTATRFTGTADYAWPVHFYYGNAAYGDNIGRAYRVRCVR